MAQGFEYFVFVQEKRDQAGTVVEHAELIVNPTFVLSKDTQAVLLEAGAEVPKAIRDDPDKMDRLQVAVRPF